MTLNHIPLTMTMTSDFSREINWGENITGWTFAVGEVFPAEMAALFACTVTDGPGGIATLSADWGPLWPDGRTGSNLVTFYVKASTRDAALLQFRIRLI